MKKNLKGTGTNNNLKGTRTNNNLKGTGTNNNNNLFKSSNIQNERIAATKYTSAG